MRKFSLVSATFNFLKGHSESGFLLDIIIFCKWLFFLDVPFFLNNLFDISCLTIKHILSYSHLWLTTKHTSFIFSSVILERNFLIKIIKYIKNFKQINSVHKFTKLKYFIILNKKFSKSVDFYFFSFIF